MAGTGRACRSQLSADFDLSFVKKKGATMAPFFVCLSHKLALTLSTGQCAIRSTCDNVDHGR